MKKLTENKVDFKHELKNVPWLVCSARDFESENSSTTNCALYGDILSLKAFLSDLVTVYTIYLEIY